MAFFRDDALSADNARLAYRAAIRYLHLYRPDSDPERRLLLEMYPVPMIRDPIIAENDHPAFYLEREGYKVDPDCWFPGQPSGDPSPADIARWAYGRFG